MGPFPLTEIQTLSMPEKQTVTLKPGAAIFDSIHEFCYDQRIKAISSQRIKLPWRYLRRRHSQLENTRKRSVKGMGGCYGPLGANNIIVAMMHRQRWQRNSNCCPITNCRLQVWGRKVVSHQPGCDGHSNGSFFFRANVHWCFSGRTNHCCYWLEN